MFEKLQEKRNTKLKANLYQKEASEYFNRITSSARSVFNNEYVDAHKKLLYIDFLINSVLNDVCSDNLLLSLLDENYSYKKPFPTAIYDMFHSEQLFSTQSKQLIELSKVKLYVHPWDTGRMINNLSFLSQTDFEYHPSNHFSYYFPLINLCYVTNGYHSITSGHYFKKGTIESDVILLEEAFPRCETDGLNWYDSATKEIIRYSDCNYKFATIYSLAKLKYSLINELKAAD